MVKIYAKEQSKIFSQSRKTMVPSGYENIMLRIYHFYTSDDFNYILYVNELVFLFLDKTILI